MSFTTITIMARQSAVGNPHHEPDTLHRSPAWCTARHGLSRRARSGPRYGWTHSLKPVQHHLPRHTPDDRGGNHLTPPRPVDLPRLSGPARQPRPRPAPGRGADRRTRRRGGGPHRRARSTPALRPVPRQRRLGHPRRDLSQPAVCLRHVDWHRSLRRRMRHHPPHSPDQHPPHCPPQPVWFRTCSIRHCPLPTPGSPSGKPPSPLDQDQLNRAAVGTSRNCWRAGQHGSRSRARSAGDQHSQRDSLDRYEHDGHAGADDELHGGGIAVEKLGSAPVRRYPRCRRRWR